MISILQASAHQAEILTEITISAKSHWGYPETWMQTWIPLMTITPEYIDTHETWVAVEEDHPIAYYSFNKNEEGFWLDNLWVLPEYIGQGIGKSLFQHALERCKQLGISTLKIEADPHAQSFYERIGAQKVDEHLTEIEGQPRNLPVMEINL